jgi:putative NADPH-quinone reductase
VSIDYHDLYREHPDPLLSEEEIARRATFDPLIQQYGREIQNAELLVVVHPDWWGGPPALMKGWVERVFRAGVAYEWVGPEFEVKHHGPLLKRLNLFCFITTDRDTGEPLGHLDTIWRELCSYSGATHRGTDVFPETRNSTMGERRTFITTAASRLSTWMDSARRDGRAGNEQAD